MARPRNTLTMPKLATVFLETHKVRGRDCDYGAERNDWRY
jgi:hypothetical protein